MYLQRIAKLICSIYLLSGCITTIPEDEVSGPYFGVNPTDQPQLLVPELIASTTEEYNGTFSSDGTEFFYTTDIPENAFITVTRMQQDSSWSEPEIASFSGKYSDYDPIFSPDGSRLYFSSSRPYSDNEFSGIWYTEKQGDEWGEPKPVKLSNSGKDEYYNSITNDGSIYFDIWPKILKGTKSENGYIIEELDSIVNGGYNKADPFISPDEDYLIYRGYRDDSFGRGDLYITYRDGESWTKPVNLGKPINSEAHEMSPYVTPDGRLFIFASDRIIKKIQMKPGDKIRRVHDKYRDFDNGELNVYYMSADFINEMRPKK